MTATQQSASPALPATKARAWPTLRKPSWHIDDGALVLVKWIAIISMLVDHFNSLVLFPQGSLSVEAFYFGRLAAPLFAIMIGYNLARPDSASTTRQKRAARTLALLVGFALLSVPVCIYARPEGYPLNILFGLASGVVAILMCMYIANNAHHLITRVIMGFSLALWLMFFGWPAEFGYCVPFTVMFSYLVWRTKEWQGRVVVLLLMIGGVFTFASINGNHFAMLSLPLLLLASCLNWPQAWRMHRLFFYVLYPAHLLIFAYIGNLLAPAA